MEKAGIKVKKRKNLRKNILALFIISLLCIKIPLEAKAAAISVKAEKDVVATGEEFPVTVNLDTRGQDVNSVKVTIAYAADILEFQKIVLEGSIVSFWIEPPEVKETGKLVMSGVIPGGFSGSEGRIVTVVFKGLKAGSANFLAEDIQVLMNDQRGSELRTVCPESGVTVSTAQAVAEDAAEKSWEDNLPPEPFEVAVSKHEDVFDGRWFLAFEAQDRGSGIDHYEVQETKTGAPSDEGWVRTGRSPYLLADQKTRSYIYVKAVDKDNNTRIEMLNPPSKPNYSAAAAILLSGLAALLGIRALVHHLKKQ